MNERETEGSITKRYNQILIKYCSPKVNSYLVLVDRTWWVGRSEIQLPEHGIASLHEQSRNVKMPPITRGPTALKLPWRSSPFWSEQSKKAVFTAALVLRKAHKYKHISTFILGSIQWIALVQLKAHKVTIWVLTDRPFLWPTGLSTDWSSDMQYIAYKHDSNSRAPVGRGKILTARLKNVHPYIHS